MKKLDSIGHLCCAHGLSLEVIREAIERLAMKPALLLNGVPYYDETQQAKIFAELINSRALENVMINFEPVPTKVVVEEEIEF